MSQVPTLTVFNTPQVWQMVCARLVMQCWPATCQTHQAYHCYISGIAICLEAHKHITPNTTSSHPKKGNIL
jgi:hypothetical protein